MTKHIHHDMICEWAADTSQIVQVWHEGQWVDEPTPEWFPSETYRIKPGPKPDLTEDINITHVTTAVVFGDRAYPNLRLTFDAETKQLKSAEVLK